MVGLGLDAVLKAGVVDDRRHVDTEQHRLDHQYGRRRHEHIRGGHTAPESHIGSVMFWFAPVLPLKGDHLRPWGALSEAA
ncbi:hypothetical protein GCM10009658_24460 [Planotetraspora silvatica]